jgi:hypothetical protein
MLEREVLLLSDRRQSLRLHFLHSNVILIIARHFLRQVNFNRKPELFPLPSWNLDHLNVLAGAFLCVRRQTV